MNKPSLSRRGNRSFECRDIAGLVAYLENIGFSQVNPAPSEAARLARGVWKHDFAELALCYASGCVVCAGPDWRRVERLLSGLVPAEAQISMFEAIEVRQ